MTFCTSVVGTKKTAEEVVDKLIEEAAVEGEARTAEGRVLPEVEMQEGERHFPAASDVAQQKGTEPVTTEAATVAPSTGVGAGDRLLGSKPKKSEQTEKASKLKVELFVRIHYRVHTVSSFQEHFSRSQSV